MKQTLNLALVVAGLGVATLPLTAEPVDCLKIGVAVQLEIKAHPDKLLEIVEAQVAASQDCACEIVKAAITASEAGPSQVATIVEVAATAAPEKMRIIAQCAVAVAPDSLAKVQAVLARLDPNRGEGEASAKGGMEKAPIAAAPAVPNPLDFPVGTVPPVIGPPTGGPPPLPPGLPPSEQPIVTPPVTDVQSPPANGNSYPRAS